MKSTSQKHGGRLQDRAAIKAERAAARGGKQQAAVEESDPLAHKYGDAPLVQSQAVTGRVWTRVESVDESMVGKTVLVRGRVHAVRGKGKGAFLVLRQAHATLQARSPTPHGSTNAFPQVLINITVCPSLEQ